MRKPMSSKGRGALLTANVDRYFVFILDLPVSQVCKNNALNFFLIAPLRNQLGLRILFVIPRTSSFRLIASLLNKKVLSKNEYGWRAI